MIPRSDFQPQPSCDSTTSKVSDTSDQKKHRKELSGMEDAFPIIEWSWIIQLCHETSFLKMKTGSFGHTRMVDTCKFLCTHVDAHIIQNILENIDMTLTWTWEVQCRQHRNFNVHKWDYRKFKVQIDMIEIFLRWLRTEMVSEYRCYKWTSTTFGDVYKVSNQRYNKNKLTLRTYHCWTAGWIK